MKKIDYAPAKASLIPLAKQGRTIVKGKCSACGSTFTATREGLEGSVADQFGKHLEHRHATDTNGGLGSSVDSKDD